LLTRPVSAAPPTGADSITIGANPNSGQVPLTVQFSGSYLDSEGVPIPNAPLYLIEQGSPQGPLTTFTTNSQGTFSGEYTFTEAGTYGIFVSDNAQGL